MTNLNYLKNLNTHTRDSSINLDESTHTYTIDGETDYISVTSWNHSHFEAFDSDRIIKRMMSGKNWKESKYYGMDAEQIKNLWNKNRDEASTAGTKMHFDIECFYNKIPVNNTSIEFLYFKNFEKDHPNLKPYRTEWMIYDKDIRMAGSIDIIWKNEDGTYTLGDWKRCSKILKTNNWAHAKTMCIQHIEDCNFWHYSLQLWAYKTILEKNYQIEIKNMFLICLHPNNENNSYIKYEIPDLSKEIKNLFEIRYYEINGSLQYRLPKLIQEYLKNKSAIKKLFLLQDKLLEKIYNLDEDFEDEIELDSISFQGKTFYLDKSNNYIYNIQDELIGIWFQDKIKYFVK